MLEAVITYLRFEESIWEHTESVWDLVANSVTCSMIVAAFQRRTHEELMKLMHLFCNNEFISTRVNTNEVLSQNTRVLNIDTFLVPL